MVTPGTDHPTSPRRDNAEVQPALPQLAESHGKIRALIVDDQAIAREALRRLVGKETDIEVVGLCESGQEALAAIQSLSPDLVFLDVQMPDLNGFDVLGRIDPAHMPFIIFVTGNDDFALDAFDVHALDYLVKPCNAERLQKSLQRVRKQLAGRRTGHVSGQLEALLKNLQSGGKSADRFAVKTGGRVVLVKADDISWVEAEDNYVKLHVGAEAHLARETMNAMEGKLPATKFLRISRSVIVNLEKVKELQPLFHGEYTVILRDGTRLTLSRNYRDKLEQFGLS